MRALGRLLAALVACVGVIATATGASAAPSPARLVCTGGNIASGTYSSVVVAGACYVPSGFVRVTGDLTVAPGALLDATTPAGGFGPGGANLPGIVQVGGNVKVGKGGVLFLGCDFAIGCPFGSSTYPGPPGLFPQFGLGFSNPGDVVSGNLEGVGALGVVVHSVKIGGNAALIGGGGGAAQLTGGPGSALCLFAVPPPAPWSSDPTLIGVPVYSDFEENSMGGNLSLMNLQTCWMGSLRNKVGGNLIDVNNTFGDPDANEVLTNFVTGNIMCFNNNSVVQIGDSAGPPNVVSGNALGECGFGVIDPTGGPISVPG